jgi:rRNA processing protein Krr1/Pno1
VQISAPRWMHSTVKGDHKSRLESLRTAHPDVRINFRDDFIGVEGPPEEVEIVRKQIQTVIDEIHSKNITCAEVSIDQQYYKQLIGKNQARLLEIQEQTGCEIRFPSHDEDRLVQVMGAKENVEKGRQMLLERVQKLVRRKPDRLGTIDYA